MTKTTYLELQKHTIGATTGWGTQQNNNYDLIDAEFSRLNDLITGGASAVEGAYPVGSLFLSTIATDPATQLGFGTWAPFAEGRAIVGVGTADGVSWATEQNRGAAERNIGVNNLPSHTHTVGGLTAAAAGLHSHAAGTLEVGDDVPTVTNINDLGGVDNVKATVVARGSTPTTNGYRVDAADATNNPHIELAGNGHSHSMSGNTAQAGSHTHNITGTIDNTGGDDPLNVIQPSIGVYIWKRTA